MAYPKDQIPTPTLLYIALLKYGDLNFCVQVRTLFFLIRAYPKLSIVWDVWAQTTFKNSNIGKQKIKKKEKKLEAVTFSSREPLSSLVCITCHNLFISFNFMLFYSTPFVSMLPSALLSSPLLSFANVFVPMDVQGTVLDLLQRKEHCTGKVLRR